MQQRIPRRQYTDDFKAQAVSLAESVGPAQAARQLEMSAKILANWLGHSRNGSPLRSTVRRPVDELESELARLMRKEGLRGKTKGRFKPKTTDSRHWRPVADNVLDRRFSVDSPIPAWVGDITYIPTQEGWLYLATVISVQTRQVLGYSRSGRVVSFGSRQPVRQSPFHQHDHCTRLQSRARAVKVVTSMGVAQATVARLESSAGNRKHAPSVATLRGYADAVNCDLHLTLTPRRKQA